MLAETLGECVYIFPEKTVTTTVSVRMNWSTLQQTKALNTGCFESGENAPVHIELRTGATAFTLENFKVGWILFLFISKYNQYN